MRIRSIKPEFWSHRMHRIISVEDSLVAIASLSYSDDEGRFIADAELFKAACFPLRPNIDPQASWEVLEGPGVNFLTLYHVEIDGAKVQVAQVVNWSVHQKIDRPTPSRIPGPDGKVRRDEAKQGVLAEWMVEPLIVLTEACDREKSAMTATLEKGWRNVLTTVLDEARAKNAIPEWTDESTFMVALVRQIPGTKVLRPRWFPADWHEYLPAARVSLKRSAPKKVDLSERIRKARIELRERREAEIEEKVKARSEDPGKRMPIIIYRNEIELGMLVEEGTLEKEVFERWMKTGKLVSD